MVPTKFVNKAPSPWGQGHAIPHMYFMIRVHCGNLVTVNDSCGPPYLIWNWYLMVSPPYIEQVSYGPTTCIIWWSPLSYIEHVSYGPPTCTYSPPHVQSDGPPYLIWNMYHMVPPHVCMVPYMYNMIFSGQLRKSPLRLLMKYVEISQGWTPLHFLSLDLAQKGGRP